MSKVVFVGNLPYDASEETIVELFQTVGRVESFRLIHDKDTKKPRGYGFCQFLDAETAACAIRNLNQTHFLGRAIRVGPAEANNLSPDVRVDPPTLFSKQSGLRVFGEPNTGILAAEDVEAFCQDLGVEKQRELLQAIAGLARETTFDIKAFLQHHTALCHVLVHSLQQLYPSQGGKSSESPEREAKRVRSGLNKQKTKDLLIRIMSMTEEEINNLPDERRSELLALKKRLQNK